MALLLVSFFIGIFSRHVLVMFARAERNFVDATIININSALDVRLALAVLDRDYESLAQLVTGNPMEFLQAAPATAPANSNETVRLLGAAAFTAPRNYMGIIESAARALVPAGVWYFDRGSEQLVYRVRNDEMFVSDNEYPEIRLRLRLAFTDADDNKRFDPSIDRIHQARLEPANSFSWQF